MKATVINAPISDFGGDAAYTTATSRKGVTIPAGTKEVIVNCSGDWKLKLAPPLVACFKTTDNEATFTDYTSEATDKSTSTSVVLSSLDTAANGDYWYVACKYKYGGIWVDVDGTNSTATDTMTGYYWNGVGWTNITITDGTSSGSVCLAQDGAITWTVPSDWKPMLLSDLFPSGTITNLPASAQTEYLFVVRFQTDKAFDSSVTLDEVTVLGDNVTRPHGNFQADTDYEFNIDRDRVGCLDYYDSAGSKSLLVTFAYND